MGQLILILLAVFAGRQIWKAMIGQDDGNAGSGRSRLNERDVEIHLKKLHEGLKSASFEIDSLRKELRVVKQKQEKQEEKLKLLTETTSKSQALPAPEDQPQQSLTESERPIVIQSAVHNFEEILPVFRGPKHAAVRTDNGKSDSEIGKPDELPAQNIPEVEPDVISEQIVSPDESSDIPVPVLNDSAGLLAVEKKVTIEESPVVLQQPEEIMPIPSEPDTPSPELTPLEAVEDVMEAPPVFESSSDQAIVQAEEITLQDHESEVTEVQEQLPVGGIPSSNVGSCDESPPPEVPDSAFDWENFLGKNLFAWIGGFLLFLASAFLVKYSIDEGILTVEIRIFLAFLLGFGAYGTGYYLKSYPKYELTVQSLCAAGLAILYADCLAARHFLEWSNFIVLPALMVITTAAFVTSVMLDSKFVAIMALVSGFLNPPILSTGENHPLGLFVYTLILNLGLISVALQKQWGFLVAMGATGTILTQLGWAHKFPLADNGLIALGAVSGFALLYNIVEHFAAKRHIHDPWISHSAALSPIFSLWLGAVFIHEAVPNMLFYPFLFLMTLLSAYRSYENSESQIDHFTAVIWASFILIFARLLSNTQIYPTFALFVFLSLFNAMTVFIGVRRKWGGLIAYCAAGTVLTQMIWYSRHSGGDNALAYAVMLWFAFFFNAAEYYAAKRNADDNWIAGSAALVPLSSLWLAGKLIRADESVAMIFSFIYLVNLMTVYRTHLRGGDGRFLLAGSGITFGLTWLWASGKFSDHPIACILAFVGFAVFYGLNRLLADYRGIQNGKISLAGSAAAVAVISVPAYMLTLDFFRANPVYMVSFILFTAVMVAWQTIRDTWLSPSHLLTTIVAFVVIFIWSLGINPENLPLALLTFALFPLFHLVSYKIACRRSSAEGNIKISAALSPLLAMGFCIGLLSGSLPFTPWPGIGLLVFLNVLMAWQSLKDEFFGIFFCGGVSGTFLLLWLWFGLSGLATGRFLGAALFLAFSAGYLAYYLRLRRDDPSDDKFWLPAALFPLAAMSCPAALIYLPHGEVSQLLPLSTLLLLNLIISFQALLTDAARTCHTIASVCCFLILAYWTQFNLTEATLLLGLVFFVIFALLHAAFPVVLQRFRPKCAPYKILYLYAPMMLALIAYPVFIRGMLGSSIWLAVFVINCIGLASAWILSSAWVGQLMLVLTMISLGGWAWQLKTSGGDLFAFLMVGFLFSVAFQLWSNITSKKIMDSGGSKIPKPILELKQLGYDSPGGASEINVDAAPNGYLNTGFGQDVDEAVFPAMSAFLPFALLAIATGKIENLTNPSLIFSFALLMHAMLLRLSIALKMSALAVMGSAGVFVIQTLWYACHFSAQNALIPTLWFALFFCLVFGFPFFARKKLPVSATLWYIAAASGLFQFPFLNNGIWQPVPGLLPLLLFIPYMLAAKFIVSGDDETRPSETPFLTLFCGGALLFLTAVWPMQFDKEWLTVTWSILGSFLIWFYIKLPLEGIRFWGLALLVVSFARLALNPALFSYYPSSGLHVFNWYLYTFGIAAAAMFHAGRSSAPPRNKIGGFSIRDGFFIMGVVLTFLLMNIEIADWFTEPGKYVDLYKASRSLGEKLAYSISWTLFSVGLLVTGIVTNRRLARISSIVLMLVSIMKIFAHDLWALGGLHRVASVMGIGVSLLLFSFLYQKYISPTSEKPDQKEIENKPGGGE